MKKKNTDGFTLLELLIYITLVVTVTLAVSQVFLTLIKGSAKADARLEVSSNLRFALDKISQDIQAAEAVNFPMDIGETSSDLELNIDGSAVHYCVAENRLFRSVDEECNETAEPLTSNALLVDGLSFMRSENTNDVLSKTVVSISTTLMLSYNSSSPDYQYGASKKITASLR